MRNGATNSTVCFCALIAGAVLFQLALAAGLPWGNVAWGGAYPGVLPIAMRCASLGSAILLLVLALIVVTRAGWMLPQHFRLSQKLVWVVVVYCALGVVANSITPSFWERVIWLPVCSLLLISSVLVARSKK
jgi:hypothetical protein